MVSCGWIHARVHEPSATLILSEAGREGDMFGSDRAFDLRTGALAVGAASPEVRRALALPTSWLFASGALFAISALLALAPSRARRALARADQWSQATLRADGAIELSDGSTAPAPYAAGLAPGPVVVLAPMSPRETAPFRAAATSSIARDQLRAGTLASVLGELEAEVDARQACATCAAAASLAPWIGALAEGLLR
jgi:hypothetical protein